MEIQTLNRLRIIRKAKGYSLEQLAILSGVSKSEINDIERGLKIPGQLTIMQISDALDMPAYKIFKLNEKFPF